VRGQATNYSDSDSRRRITINFILLSHPPDEANPHTWRASMFTAFSTCTQVHALARLSAGISTVGTKWGDFPSLCLLPEAIVDWVEVPHMSLMLWVLCYMNSWLVIHAQWLRQCNFVAQIKSSRVYWKKPMSWVKDSPAMKSASVVKQVMWDCSLEDQETTPPPMRTTKPVVGLAESISPAKSLWVTKLGSDGNE